MLLKVELRKFETLVFGKILCQDPILWENDNFLEMFNVNAELNLRGIGCNKNDGFRVSFGP